MTELVLPPKITDGSVSLTFSFIWDGVTYSTGAYFGYCSIADVSFEWASLAGYTTLTNTNIAQEISYAAIELQEALATAYTMPYGGTHQGVLVKLREMNAKMAFARVINRYFTSNTASANHSEAAAEKLGWVNHQVSQILDGHIRWDAPFGDAVGTARLPVFSKAAASSAAPDPGSNLSSADPIFSLSDPGTRRNGNNNLM